MTDTKPGAEDTGVDQERDSYEIDLDAVGDIEEAMEEAVAALDGEGDADPSADGEASGDGEDGDLRQRLADSESRYLRLLADFENFRKRSDRERERIGRYALQEPLRAFLDAIDNLERALAAGGDVETLKQGLEMTLRGLADGLKRYGVEAVEAVGQPFDPAVHEAVSRRDDPDVEEATVVAEMQRGYRLHDRLVRPAMVVVAVPADEGG